MKKCMFKCAKKKCLKKVTIIGVLIGLWLGACALYDNVFNVKSFEQKVVLITGTASGIGKATAEHLIEKGHIVYGGDIQFSQNKYLNDIGGHALEMDVTNPVMVNAGVEKIIAEQGRIDVLFNNAGYGLYGAVEEVSMEDVRQQFEVNVFGYAQLVKAVMPYMRAQGDGLILNNTSVGGHIYTPLGAWYHATKHALEGWSDALRFEVKHFGVDVVVIEPGFINTNFGGPVAKYLTKYRPGTAYEHIYKGFDALMNDPEGSTIGSSEPQVIAEAVEDAMNAKKPKTRYARGMMSKELIILRDLCTDRCFDWFIGNMFGIE